MSESLLRSFFTLFYERLGPLLLWSALRASPWVLVTLSLTFLPPASLGGAYAWLLGALALGAFLLAPYLSGGIHAACARLARGEEPDWTEGLGRRYRILLLWNLIQSLLAGLILWNLGVYIGLPPAARGFAMLLALGTGFWLWCLTRLWSFRFVPLLINRDTSLRDTVRLTLLFILARPGPSLVHFLQRQLLMLLLAFSGLGLIFGLGGLGPLHAALSGRLALRELGLDLGPAGTDDPGRPLPTGEGFRRLWRPWE